MSDTSYHLIKHFVKPEPGEYVPIEFIEITKKTVAWSPRLKQSVYVTDDMQDADKLKRVREINVLKAINQLSGNITTIELNDEEKEQFEDVYKAYMERGGQILFSRRRAGKRTVSFFELMEGKDRKKEVAVNSMLLSDKLERE
ncbi:hypothetical protein ANME2D_02194 [Candidatus Methanoperedens nitroreducens]|uniref:Uncharacterized protein n=1 Tax=Candidatus Methanoperedens nitratireducens TaxID=1392998 RepID=A0A062V6T5_9EURY|nr:hypothetical protein [Candidatus Methanoperedens nitroreducens]KCZ71464.1 hypothetical protein ANME2D_02194 [Candidatus Methanoperedens nitroreducens]MDJ1421092.1 hypothetical protein [Candidatus Methanoperedens sp.]